MTASPSRVLVLGATGMLGHTLLRVLAESPGFEVQGIARSLAGIHRLPAFLQSRVHGGVDVIDFSTLHNYFYRIRPQVVINAVGIVKQLSEANDPVRCIELNAIFPHRLAAICQQFGSRLIQISTDCVFSGLKGFYSEEDPPDPKDLYGRSKLLGEIDLPSVITLRTSIIGHELNAINSHGLIGWFLNQQGDVRGFRGAVFSGLPTVELSYVIRDVIIPRPDLHGIFHVAADPINKFDLLAMVARYYGKLVNVIPVDEPVIDRSLNPRRFQDLTGYSAPEWPELLMRMERFR